MASLPLLLLSLLLLLSPPNPAVPNVPYHIPQVPKASLKDQQFFCPLKACVQPPDLHKRVTYLRFFLNRLYAEALASAYIFKYIMFITQWQSDSQNLLVLFPINPRGFISHRIIRRYKGLLWNLACQARASPVSSEQVRFIVPTFPFFSSPYLLLPKCFCTLSG